MVKVNVIFFSICASSWSSTTVEKTFISPLNYFGTFVGNQLIMWVHFFLFLVLVFSLIHFTLAQSPLGSSTTVHIFVIFYLKISEWQNSPEFLTSSKYVTTHSMLLCYQDTMYGECPIHGRKLKVREVTVNYKIVAVGNSWSGNSLTFGRGKESVFGFPLHLKEVWNISQWHFVIQIKQNSFQVQKK